jgi:hypothetical protein
MTELQSQMIQRAIGAASNRGDTQRQLLAFIEVRCATYSARTTVFGDGGVRRDYNIDTLAASVVRSILLK